MFVNKAARNANGIVLFDQCICEILVFTLNASITEPSIINATPFMKPCRAFMGKLAIGA